MTGISNCDGVESANNFYKLQVNNYIVHARSHKCYNQKSIVAQRIVSILIIKYSRLARHTS